MPNIPAEKILSLIAELREVEPTSVHIILIVDALQRMVDNEIEALDAYYEQMAQEAYEMEDGRRAMEDAALEKSIRYLDES